MQLSEGLNRLKNVPVYQHWISVVVQQKSNWFEIFQTKENFKAQQISSVVVQFYPLSNFDFPLFDIHYHIYVLA